VPPLYLYPSLPGEKFFLRSRAQWEKIGQISFCPLIFSFPYTYGLVCSYNCSRLVPTK
jgi:hypothetical protein